ncbi:N-acetylmuramate alpha-1-phosphate uridylyltransferase [Roseobacter fucihabitans]|uniref:N-acetylmuramate alpha-1-phosphate uridylyltransferase n=1 Tax=Roseobacter fucihabitans TaxID=1537242 RepID=A0ABZ2C181_9RHOB|nr:nucleotidyltransferase family protein [Roseobacter litoralis]MBC6963888.1 D-glycero-alpha-D-manno-heptose 1-phosphate guanylyltransferase [Roseobacter litoralis]MBC6964027.1 D-glycero-alpha-D-manno-heptose 1-phosphate guanylyltransferase [Roseobacter litoralis]
MRDIPQSLMLFAAGFGARMRPLTNDIPKPMVRVAGRPLIDYALDQTNGVEIDRIVANMHYKPAPLETHLAGTGVQTVLETPEILDTGGGLRNALPLLGPGPVFTLNTDAVWLGPSPLAWLRDAWRPNDMDALLMCIPVAQTHGYAGQGDFQIGPNGHLTRGQGQVYGGAQIIKTERLAEIGETKFSLNVLWDLMHAENRLFGLSYPGDWCDVGHPAGVETAQNQLARRDV